MASPVSPVMYTPATQYATPGPSYAQTSSTLMVPQAPAAGQIQQVQSAGGSATAMAPNVSPYIQPQAPVAPSSPYTYAANPSQNAAIVQSQQTGYNPSIGAPLASANSYPQTTAANTSSYSYSSIPAAPAASIQNSATVAQGQPLGNTSAGGSLQPSAQATAVRPSSSYSKPGGQAGSGPVLGAPVSTQPPGQAATLVAATNEPDGKAKAAAMAEKLGKAGKSTKAFFKTPQGKRVAISAGAVAVGFVAGPIAAIGVRVVGGVVQHHMEHRDKGGDGGSTASTAGGHHGDHHGDQHHNDSGAADHVL